MKKINWYGKYKFFYKFLWSHANDAICMKAFKQIKV